MVGAGALLGGVEAHALADYGRERTVAAPYGEGHFETDGLLRAVGV